ncbi:MAG: hypothetical protein LBD75_03110 [Candidatus Peribacteria bacterium]|jgi:hypothetical protein|nr:hypothetical protein [Candidatus Peribacteria bacterium]
MSGTQATFTPLSNTSRTLKEVDKKAVSGDYTLTFSDRLMSTKFCNGI